MTIRFIAFFGLLLSAVYVFAEKKMTFRDPETGESFEVTVPDGLKIYEYSSNWLDSIPYLMERARYGEPWAYEALGDCYRYGKGGVEMSVFKSMAYYMLSETDLETKVFDSVADNSHDYLSLTYQLFEKIESEDWEGVQSTIDIFEEEGFYDANIVKACIGEISGDSIATLVANNLNSPNVSADKMMFTIMACVLQEWFWQSFDIQVEVFITVAKTFPYLSNFIAEKFYSKGNEYPGSVELAEHQEEILYLLEIADREAMLSREGAAILYNHYISEYEAGRMVLDQNEMERLATVARLPESETFIFMD